MPSMKPKGQASKHDRIVSSYANDPDMMDLVELFVAELPQKIQAIAQAQLRGEINTIQRVAHQLKGASSGYGFDPIGQVAATLETAAKSRNLDHIKRQIDELTAMCARVVS